MRRWALAAALLLLAGAAAFRIGPSGPRRESPATAPGVDVPAPGEGSAPPPPKGDPLVLFRGNAACDEIRTLEHRVRLYRKALGLPSDEWIRLLNQIRISAGELWDAPPPVASDAELAFKPGAYAQVQAAALELSRLAGYYYDAARARNAAAVASYRPAFDERWGSFQALVLRSLRP